MTLYARTADKHACALSISGHHTSVPSLKPRQALRAGDMLALSG